MTCYSELIATLSNGCTEKTLYIASLVQLIYTAVVFIAMHQNNDIFMNLHQKKASKTFRLK